VRDVIGILAQTLIHLTAWWSKYNYVLSAALGMLQCSWEHVSLTDDKP